MFLGGFFVVVKHKAIVQWKKSTLTFNKEKKKKISKMYAFVLRVFLARSERIENISEPNFFKAFHNFSSGL